MSEWRERVQAATGQRVVSSSQLTGGCIAEVWRAQLADGSRVVAKVAGHEGALDVEGYMLGYLRENSGLPVPSVRHAEPSLLVMDFVEGTSRFSPAAERNAAELLAELHGTRGPRFGFERDTLIGPLPQPNPKARSWVEFFRDHRLIAMSRRALDSRNLPPATHNRVLGLAANLATLIEEPAHPSLLHGDVWTTNVLAQDDHIAAFLDPSTYWGHPEIELAFITLFSTFGAAFFDRYAELRPIRSGFFEQRRHVYNLYPLLVHTTLFGGGYASQVSSSLRMLGY